MAVVQDDMTNTFDLVIRAGRVVDPAQGIDGPGQVAVRRDRIAVTAVVDDQSEPQTLTAPTVLSFPDGVLLPGLVDMHSHPDVAESRIGIEPDTHILARGVTTVLSQGDVGAQNMATYRQAVIERTQLRIRLAINLAASGETKPYPSFATLGEADVNACIEAIHTDDDLIWGIAVNVCEIVCGDTDPREILRRAIRVGEQTNRPLLVGTRLALDFPLDELLKQLRPGDVVTYCFHNFPDRLEHEGHVMDCVWDARERGVLFDIGHGMGSFDFNVAETVIRDGFLPDTISTDKHQRHLRLDPQHDLPRTVSKLLASGMHERDVWPRVTTRPAELLGLSGEIGTLASGSCADLVVLTRTYSAISLYDVNGNTRSGPAWTTAAVVRAGQVIVNPTT